MKVKDEFFSRGLFKIGDGTAVRFWEDTWLGLSPLAQQYPALYSIVQHKHVTVANVLSTVPLNVPLNIGFKRQLTGNKWNSWIHLCQKLMGVSLDNVPDEFIWKLTTNG